MVVSRGDQPVSISPSQFVVDSLLDLSMEQALARNLRPPRDPPTSNKVGLRKVMPNLIELIGTYAAQHHTSRAVVTFGLSDYAVTWVESLLVAQSSSIMNFRSACAYGGHLDLLSLLKKDEFACGDWPDYGQGGTTTIVVQDGVKGRLGRLSDDIGIPQGAIIQFGLAWAWTQSSLSDSSGTVGKYLVPQIKKFEDIVFYCSIQIGALQKMLRRRDGKINYLDGVTIR